MHRSLTRLSLILSIGLLAACGSQPPAPEQPPAGVTDGRPGTPGGGAAAAAPITATDIDPSVLAALKDPKSPLSKRSIFFDYDQYVIKDEFRPLVEAHGKFLAANPKLKVLIQGNADERGSREYNLALGQKRADAIKRALMVLGAREEQVESVSLGEEKPRCTESTEACWAQNRRGDLLYSGEF